MRKMLTALGTTFRWSIFTIGLAAIIHIVFVFALPSLIMGQVHGALTKQVGVNGTLHPPRPTWESRGVVRPSPDLLYSICPFQLLPLYEVRPLSRPPRDDDKYQQGNNQSHANEQHHPDEYTTLRCGRWC